MTLHSDGYANDASPMSERRAILDTILRRSPPCPASRSTRSRTARRATSQLPRADRERRPRRVHPSRQPRRSRVGSRARPALVAGAPVAQYIEVARSGPRVHPRDQPGAPADDPARAAEGSRRRLRDRARRRGRRHRLPCGPSRTRRRSVRSRASSRRIVVIADSAGTLLLVAGAARRLPDARLRAGLIGVGKATLGAARRRVDGRRRPRQTRGRSPGRNRRARR